GAGVVAHPVDAPRLLGRAGADAARDVGVGDVRGQPLAAELLGRLAQRLLPARDHQRARALLRQLGAERPADAAAGARHDAPPIAQSEVHGADHAGTITAWPPTPPTSRSRPTSAASSCASPTTSSARSASPACARAWCSSAPCTSRLPSGST